jgi:hypothetical protein
MDREAPKPVSRLCQCPLRLVLQIVLGSYVCMSLEPGENPGGYSGRRSAGQRN